MSIRIDGTNTTANPGITGSDTDTGLQFGTNEVKVVTDGSDRVTVDSSGRLLLNSGSDVRIELGTNGTTGTNDRNHLRGDGDNLKYNCCADGVHVFETNGTERMRILSSGGLTFNGDTAQANALDDYEEGTFTPRLVIENSGDVTVDNKNGSYVKVGSTVTVWFNMTVNGTPSGRSTSNALEFHDLPFTSTDNSSGAEYYIGKVRINGVNTGSTYNDFSEAIIRLNNSNTMGRIELREASTSILRNSSLWMQDDTSIHATITYRTDS